MKALILALLALVFFAGFRIGSSRLNADVPFDFDNMSASADVGYVHGSHCIDGRGF